MTLTTTPQAAREWRAHVAPLPAEHRRQYLRKLLEMAQAWPGIEQQVIQLKGTAGRAAGALFRLRVSREHRIVFERPGAGQVRLVAFRYRGHKRHDYDTLTP